MNFKEFLSKNPIYSLFEIADISSLSTADIDIGDLPKFDEASAREECMEQADDLSIYDILGDMPSSPEDDPGFDGISPEEWQEDNPPPEREDYDSDEEFEAEMESWKQELELARSQYEDDVAGWHDDYESVRQFRIDDYINSYVDECVENKRREFDEDTDNRYIEYSFQHDGKDYEVTFAKEEYPRLNIDNVWSIAFWGPEGHKLTNDNSASLTIYKNLLLSVKKLLETQEVNGISFTPADPNMGLVYNRFYKKFLAKDFTPVSSSVLIRKDVLRNRMRYLSADKRSEIFGNILNTSRDTRQYLQNVLADKQRNRSYIKSIIGTMVRWIKEPAYVVDINGDTAEIITKSGNSSVVPLSSIEQLNAGGEDLMQWFNTIRNAPAAQPYLANIQRAIASKSKPNPATGFYGQPGTLGSQ